MDFIVKIKLAEAYSQISESELARRLGTTPQNFGQKIRRGRFTCTDLEKIATALGAEFHCSFKFPDGTEL